MTCARRHGIITALAAIRADLPALADLGYEGAADVVRVPVKKKRDLSSRARLDPVGVTRCDLRLLETSAALRGVG